MRSLLLGVVCRLALMALLLGGGYAPALAVVSTTATTLSNSSYTDLGAGPIHLEASGGALLYQIGDSQPSAPTSGYRLVPTGVAVDVQTSSHIWAIATTTFATKALSAPITVSGSSGGAVTQGTSPWVDSISDGTNGPVTVKPASTAPLSTDKALVTALSPNSAGIITLGQTTKSASVPVTIASDQGAQAITAASLPLPAGAATSALQTAINTTLGSPFQVSGLIGNTAFGVNAGQAAIGNVGGLNKKVCFNPTVTNGTYAANVVMGGLFTAANLFTSTGSGVIQSVELDFTTAQTVAFKVYYFEANPSNTTWTEHSAAAINATDALVVGGYISLSNADSGLGAATTTYSATGLGITYSPAGTSGYFILVPTATTASLGATSNGFNLCVIVLQNS